MFSWFKKRRLPENVLPKLADWERQCPDCGVEAGQLHDLFCLKEPCPFCGGQLATCECIHTVLALRDEERSVVENYVDDSVEPLRSIMERWEQALSKKGRIPYHPQTFAATPDGLILAAANGALPFVRLMLAAEVPINAANEVGYTALMAAARSYRLDVLDFLLKAGADVHLRDEHGHTALHCAVATPVSHPSAQSATQAECVRLLLKQGAVVDVKTPTGGTPLMNAAWFGCAPSVDLLLEAGADPKIQDARGRTAEDLARERKHEQIVKQLAAHASKQ